MSKYFDLHKDLEDKFLLAISVADLENFVDIRILGCEDQKDITKVVKATPIVQHLTGSEILLTVNEAVFELLQPLYQDIVIDEALARIYFDAEKGKVILKKPDFETFSLVLEKYTTPVMLNERETVRAIYTQGDEEPEELNTGT